MPIELSRSYVIPNCFIPEQAPASPIKSTLIRLVLCVAYIAVPALAQNPPTTPNQNAPAQTGISIRPDYTLGSNDQILIRAAGVEEMNDRPFRIDSEGFISLPIVGKVKASGLTIQALEADLTRRFKEYILEPRISLSLVQFRSEPVFFLGTFKAPGIYPLMGRRTLVEMLSSIGGLMPNASRRLRVTRRLEYGRIELPNAVENPEKKTSTVEISMESLTQDINPAADLLLQPYDIVSVDRAERVYVSGEVGKVSAIELGERDSMSIIQALTEAGGFSAAAIQSKVKILRPVLGTTRRAEIVVDMKRVLEGKDLDYPLLPNDVLYVPRSGRRTLITAAAPTFLASLPVVLLSVFVRR